MNFMFSKRNYILSLIAYSHDYAFHIILIQSLLVVFSWLCFHEYYMCYIDLECWLCDFHIFMDIFLFYSLLEGFRTSFLIYYKTKCVFIHFGRVFKLMLKLFSNLFLKTPSIEWAVGWATMPCEPNWKSS